MRRTVLLLAAIVAAFVAGADLAGGAPDRTGIAKKLWRRQRLLMRDLLRVEKAVKDVAELREMRESGEFVLNAEEKKLERQARQDLHVYMERARNDTLETLAILDRLLEKQQYVDPLHRLFGNALDEVVRVAWDEQDLETVVAEISEGYNVPINIGGEINYRRTLSLHGEMSLLSVLLYLENMYDAKLVVRGDHVWFVRVGGKKDE